MTKITFREAENNQNELHDDDVLKRIRAALLNLKHGTVTIVVQDSRVVQIDKTEKVRLR